MPPFGLALGRRDDGGERCGISRRSLLAGLGAVAALRTFGCAAPVATVTTASEPTPLTVRELVSLVPTARLRWLLAARPALLLSRPDLQAPLGRLIHAERLELYARTTGLDLRTIDEAVVAAFPDDAQLLIARHDEDPRRLERLFRERLTSGTERRVSHGRTVLVSGRTGRLSRAFVALGDHVVGLQLGGDPRSGPARVAELLASGELGAVASVWDDASIGPCWGALGASPLRWLMPGPFEGELAKGARGLLGSATAVAAAAHPTTGAGLRVMVLVDGDYDSAPDRAAELLLLAWQDLAESDLGHLLGVHEPVEPPAVTPSPGRLTLTVGLDAERLSAGLAAATMDEVPEIMR